MKKFFTRLFSPKTLTILFLFIEIVVLILFIIFLDEYLWISQLFFGIAIIPICLIIVNSKCDNSYKISWLFFLAMAPIFGIVFYLLFANKKFTKKEKAKIKPIIASMKKSMEDKKSDGYIDKIDIEKDGNCYSIANYIKNESWCNIYKDTKATFFPWGEEAFPKMKEKLRKAKHYIFLEYFIIKPGKMWNEILEILEQKVKENVDVRVIYDDFGCLATLPNNYYKILRKKGIKAFAFNKIKPTLNIRMNNRDHRKILVIDGHTGFTGGINIADEYINKDIRFGKWKDNAIMLEGDAVFSLTSLFLSTWLSFYKNKEDVNINFADYYPSKYMNETTEYKSAKGLIQPYGSLPFSYESVGHNVYLNMILKATKSIYISTPYLILNQEMLDAIKLASKSGVKVKIITPGIPDKKTVFQVTRSYYQTLIESGVEIYEYTPGFVHGKVFLVDNMMGTVGTVNLDYRSLFLHMENGTFIYKAPCLQDIKSDFEKTFLVCKKISLQDCKKTNLFLKMYRTILRVFAPLL